MGGSLALVLAGDGGRLPSARRGSGGRQQSTAGQRLGAQAGCGRSATCLHMCPSRRCPTAGSLLSSHFRQKCRPPDASVKVARTLFAGYTLFERASNIQRRQPAQGIDGSLRASEARSNHGLVRAGTACQNDRLQRFHTKTGAPEAASFRLHAQLPAERRCRSGGQHDHGRHRGRRLAVDKGRRRERDSAARPVNAFHIATSSSVRDSSVT